LELGDVVAPEHRLAEVQSPVAESEAALDERRPSLGAAHPVHVEAAALLEGAHRGFRGGAELARFVGRGVVAERGETPLEVTDRLAVCALLEPRRGHQPRRKAATAASPTVAAQPKLATATKGTVKR
jgi:hypothetical protein